MDEEHQRLMKNSYLLGMFEDQDNEPAPEGKSCVVSWYCFSKRLRCPIEGFYFEHRNRKEFEKSLIII